MRIYSIFFFFMFSATCLADMDWTHCSDFPVVQLKGSGVTIPPFYFWRKIFQLKGKAPYQAMLAEKDGTLTPVTLSGESVDDILARPSAFQTGSGNSKDGYKSVDGLWKAGIFYTNPAELKKTPTGEAGDGWNFQLENLKTGEIATCPVTKYGFGPGGYYFWDDQNELCYASVWCCDSTSRSLNLIVMDPHNLSFEWVCNTLGWIFFNEDHTWMVWESGRWLGRLKDKNYWITNIFAFNSKLKKNFIIAQGTEIDRFDRWKK